MARSGSPGKNSPEIRALGFVGFHTCASCCLNFTRHGKCSMKQSVDLRVDPERDFVSPLLRDELELAARPKTGNFEDHAD
jgi:hypothetical protein